MFLAGLVVAQFASGLVAQASGSRLLYAMGRDSVLPKAVFGRLSEKLHTPVANLVLTGIAGLIAIFLDVATSTSFINFAAFIAFTLVNASVVFHYVRQRRAGQQLNPVSYAVVPVIGAIVCAYLLSQLDSNATTLGLSSLVLGVVVLALITRGFKAGPPEMAATEKATVEPVACAFVRFVVWSLRRGKELLRGLRWGSWRGAPTCMPTSPRSTGTAPNRFRSDGGSLASCEDNVLDPRGFWESTFTKQATSIAHWCSQLRERCSSWTNNRLQASLTPDSHEVTSILTA